MRVGIVRWPLNKQFIIGIVSTTTMQFQRKLQHARGAAWEADSQTTSVSCSLLTSIFRVLDHLFPSSSSNLISLFSGPREMFPKMYLLPSSGTLEGSQFSCWFQQISCYATERQMGAAENQNGEQVSAIELGQRKHQLVSSRAWWKRRWNSGGNPWTLGQTIKRKTMSEEKHKLAL